MAAVATAAIFTGAFGAEATLAVDVLTDAPDGGWPGQTGVMRRDGVTFFGYVDSAGNIEVRSVEDGVVSSATTLHATLEADHHNGPEVFVREDGYLVAVYSQHNGSALYQRISSNPADATAWEAEANIDASVGGSQYTYPRIEQLTGETDDPLYLFVRNRTADTNAQLLMSKSTDGGATWGAATTLWSTTGTAYHSHYVRVCETDGTRLDFFVNTSALEADDGDLYHFYYEGGDWFDSAGTDIGDPPFDTTDATLVYEAPSGQGVRLPRSIERRADGTVVGLFVTFGATLDYDYYWAGWDGASWSTELVASADADLGGFGGGGSHSGPYVYISRPTGGTAHLFRYRRTASGWEGVQMTTDGGGHVYPVPVRGGRAPLRIIWLEGTYVASPYSYSWGVNGGW